MKVALCKRWKFVAEPGLGEINNYKLEVELLAEPSARGMVAGDHQLFDDAIRPLLDMVTDRLLTGVPGLETPTLENLVQWMAKHCANIFEGDVERVRVYQGSVWAEVRGGVTMRGSVAAPATTRMNPTLAGMATQAEVKAVAATARMNADLNALRTSCREAVKSYDNGRHRVARDIVAEAVGLPVDKVVVHEDIKEVERHMYEAAEDVCGYLKRGDALDQEHRLAQLLIGAMEALVAAYKRR